MIDFKQLFALAPNPYVLLDRDLRLVEMNQAYLDVTQRKREDIEGKAMFEAFPSPTDSDSYRLLEGSFRRVLNRREKDEIALIRYDIEAADGSMEARYWSATHTPLLDDDGEILFILQHTVDVTEIQELREARDEAGLIDRAREVQKRFLDLDRERELMRALFEQAPGFVAVLTGPDHKYIMANAAYSSLVGDRPLLNRSVAEALPEVVDQGFIGLLDTVRESGEPFVGRETEVMLYDPVADAERRHHLDFIFQPIFGGDGKVSGVFVQGHDVTESVLARERQDLLIHELNHRVKNTLAIVQSLAAQSFRQVDGGGDARRVFEARLAALSAAHSLLTEQNWETTGLEETVRAAVAAAAGSDRSRVDLAGPPVPLSPQTAVSLSMLVHELTTNAVKYGALSVEDGRVKVRWTLDGEDDRQRLHWTWHERGGPPVAPPASAGFGTRLIRRGLSTDGRGSVDLRYAEGGLECDIVAGLDAA